jgi:hypothetical protein
MHKNKVAPENGQVKRGNPAAHVPELFQSGTGQSGSRTSLVTKGRKSNIVHPELSVSGAITQSDPLLFPTGKPPQVLPILASYSQRANPLIRLPERTTTILGGRHSASRFEPTSEQDRRQFDGQVIWFPSISELPQSPEELLPGFVNPEEQQPYQGTDTRWRGLLEPVPNPEYRAIKDPDLPGLLGGFINSELSIIMQDEDREKLFSAKNKGHLFRIFGANVHESVTSINEKFLHYTVGSIEKNVIKPHWLTDRQKKVLKTIRSIKKNTQRPENGHETEEFKRAAQENLGIDPANLQAIKKVLALRGERITVRPVGEGETAEKAAAYQRLNLPTKPFSIKLKSETSSGFIPMNQFNIDSGKGAAPTSKTLTLYNQLMGVPDNAIEGAMGMLKNLIGIYQQTMELNADPGPGVRAVLGEKVGALERKRGSGEGLPKLSDLRPGSGNLDNHSGMTSEEILEKNPELQGTLVSENLEAGKEYLVNNTKKLPIIGDYDLYRIYSKNLLKIGLRTRDVEGAGDTTSLVLSTSLDLNIGAALGGYKGGLLFHHGAEMHNEKHAQPRDKVLKITEEGHKDKVLEGMDAIAKDAVEESRSGRSTTTRSETAMAVREELEKGIKTTVKNPLSAPRR